MVDPLASRSPAWSGFERMLPLLRDTAESSPSTLRSIMVGNASIDLDENCPDWKMKAMLILWDS